MLEHAEALERSFKVSHPDVSPDDVAFVLALAGSDAFATPGEQSAAYWQAVRTMEEKQAAAEAARMQDATNKAAQVSADYQAQRQRLSEAEQRAAHAAKMEGGGRVHERPTLPPHPGDATWRKRDLRMAGNGLR